MQAVLDGAILNKVGVKDDTLLIDTTEKIINLAVNKAKIQEKFIVSEIPANTGRLFDSGRTKFRAINVQSPLSITATREDYLTISTDTYTKTEVANKISAVVSAAPAFLLLH